MQAEDKRKAYYETTTDFCNMNKADKEKYALSVIEGMGMISSQVQVSRVDWEPISAEELEDLMSEFFTLFPKDIYRVLYQTKPSEDNEILHVYFSLQAKERLRRNGTPGKREIVPKTEVEERLKQW